MSCPSVSILIKMAFTRKTALTLQKNSKKKKKKNIQVIFHAPENYKGFN